MPEDRQFDMTDLITAVIESGFTVISFPVREYWLDVGRIEHYQKAEPMSQRGSFEQSTWSGRKVLVTGAGGFIGSHLAERLVELGADVRALVRYTSTGHGVGSTRLRRGELDIVLGDVRDFFSVRDAMRDREVVFHLAALIGIPYSYQAAQSYLHTNIEGTLNVLQAARELATERVICTSTSEVYGYAQYVPIDEEHPLQGQSPYSASKIGADKIAESYFLSFGLPFRLCAL